MRFALVGALVVSLGSSYAHAQNRDRGHHRRDRDRRQQGTTELSAPEIYQLVADAYRQVLRREPESTPVAAIEYWQPRLRGASRSEAWMIITSTMYASDEYRCLTGGCGMADDAFKALLRQLAAAPFPSDRTGLVELAAASNRFSVTQLEQIVRAMVFSSERIRAVEVICPRLVDRQNAFMLDGAFSFPGEREQARRLCQP